ncbi:hypothetical protein SUDANB145_07229 (plasmid) [Streptomyces sp. enrichment culture]|uniref:hypothetical protein n=1 Tax=Streptomyces sp. enrichment culture TaxID=1795815 RepID=UPI003F576260
MKIPHPWQTTRYTLQILRHHRQQARQRCTTCSERSGWPVTGHNDRQCRDYQNLWADRAARHAEAIRHST